jgi:N-glycosidase YbiA
MIDRFSGPYRFLSNFWPARVVLDGEEYPTTEHAYQAAKTFDPAVRRAIALSETPGKAKRAGAAAKCREDWPAVKVEIMLDLLRQKFRRHDHLKEQLLATGDLELVEGNTWGDVFWGVCNGKGENHLGRLLMRVRHEIRVHDAG